MSAVEVEDRFGSYCCLTIAIIVGLSLLAVLLSSKIRFFLKMFLYLASLIFGGTIGGIISLPYGRTTENHCRVFGAFQFLCSLFLRLNFILRNQHYIDSDRPFIIIANHQSAFDVLGMTYCWPENCVVMLKSSLKFLPGFNLAAYLCHAIFINRFSKEKAHKALDSTLDAITKYQRKVWIYPEGTRNPGNVMLPFKKGAFVLSMEAKVPIICCVFSSHSFFYDATAQKLTDGECLVEFLPPVEPSNFSDVVELSDHCWNIMMAKYEELNKELSNKLSHKSN